MSELKKKANPRYKELAELEKTINEGGDKIDICVVLLDRLCTLKENQQESDNTFREDWRQIKIRDTRVSWLILIIASAAFYLDVIKVDAGIAAAVMGLFQ